MRDSQERRDFCLAHHGRSYFCARRQIGNGSWQVVLWCQDCGGIAATGTNGSGEAIRNRYLPHSAVLDVMELPVVETGGKSLIPCERCGGSDGVEQHHWAPKALFSDSYQWPTADLCVKCHARWHQVIDRSAALITADTARRI